MHNSVIREEMATTTIQKPNLPNPDRILQWRESNPGRNILDKPQCRRMVVALVTDVVADMVGDMHCSRRSVAGIVRLQPG